MLCQRFGAIFFVFCAKNERIGLTNAPKAKPAVAGFVLRHVIKR